VCDLTYEKQIDMSIQPAQGCGRGGERGLIVGGTFDPSLLLLPGKYVMVNVITFLISKCINAHAKDNTERCTYIWKCFELNLLCDNFPDLESQFKYQDCKI
jgi:hypothetical protein